MSKDSARERRRQAETREQQSHEKFLGVLSVKLQIAKALTWFMSLAGLAVVMIAMRPLAEALADKKTVLEVNVALSLTFAVSLVGVAAFWRAHHQKKRADRLEERNRQLSRSLRQLQRRLEENNLDTSVVE